ncbi:hypothetical protein TL16_g01216 [Triparma laevis f. inornata]|uniref:Uncharacterized protein n=1 Tax=Triparma laevis f. inornata TaxID=1714386 RepID=A0A9W6ZHJ7_9STRA|nr:hypothetical protein TL16_g01216 [Triparma laevis f. inornata]
MLIARDSSTYERTRAPAKPAPVSDKSSANTVQVLSRKKLCTDADSDDSNSDDSNSDDSDSDDSDSDDSDSDDPANSTAKPTSTECHRQS